MEDKDCGCKKNIQTEEDLLSILVSSEFNVYENEYDYVPEVYEFLEKYKLPKYFVNSLVYLTLNKKFTSLAHANMAVDAYFQTPYPDGFKNIPPIMTLYSPVLLYKMEDFIPEKHLGTTFLTNPKNLIINQEAINTQLKGKKLFIVIANAFSKDINASRTLYSLLASPYSNKFEFNSNSLINKTGIYLYN